MKIRIGLGAVALSAVLGASIAYAGGSVVGSKHDMNRVSVPDTQQRVCAFCHTPHHALQSTAVDYNPLWSHTISTKNFTEYTSTTLESDGDGIDVVAGNSRLCMSCHDGAIAVDQHYGSTGNTDVRSGDSWGEIGVGAQNGAIVGDLTNDHPIGFNYAAVGGTGDSTGAIGSIAPIGTGGGLDPEIRGTASALLANGGRQIEDLLEQRAGGVQLMTCGSCHDVHDTYSVDGYFLVGHQAQSEICLTCHIK